MPEARICESCGAWLCKAEDVWCGYCGVSCAHLELTVKPSVLIRGEIAPRLGILLANPTMSPLTIQSLQPPEWIAVEPCAGRTLGPGERCLLWGTAASHLLKEPQSGEIAIETTIGKVAQSVSAIAENPEILCTPAEIEVWTVPGQSRQNVELEIAPREGELLIHSVKRGFSGGLDVATEQQDPFRASQKNRLRLILDAKSDLLVKKPHATLLVNFEGAHGAREVEVQVGMAARNPPQLTWIGQFKDPEKIYQAAGQTLRFILRNQSKEESDDGRRNARLVLQSARLTPPPAYDAAVIRPVTRMPIEIAGGEERILEFELNFERTPPAEPPMVNFDLHINANIRVKPLPVPVILRRLESVEGVLLAIDFGSSNTTCAAVQLGGDPELIPIEKNRTVSPTYIQYLSLAGDEMNVRIGSEVKRDAASDERAAASTLSRLKQRLGEPDDELSVLPENSERRVDRRVAQAVADYLHEVRRAAEINRKIAFHELIVTHPAVCSLNQFRNLNQALKQAFGNSHIQLLQEPVAAVIPFIMKTASGPDAPSHDFTVASFDLGGGTTDIAVLIVHRESRAPGSMEIQPRIVNSRGVRFGGEDLTNYLAERLLENSKRILAERYPELHVIVGRMSGVSLDSSSINEYALRLVAEQYKASMSEEKGVEAPSQLNLLVFNDKTQSGQSHTFLFQELASAGGRNLRVDFENYTRGKIRDLAELVRMCARDVNVLDYIHLSGMTSLLPIVVETIRKEFPNVKIRRADDPKECVVAGACLSVSMRYGTTRRLVLPRGAQRTTSSIGTYDVGVRSFHCVLPVNTEIPLEGLSGKREDYWFGEEKIVLWENLGLSDENVDSAIRDGLLARIGTWEPERTAPLINGQPWTLRLLLKDFDVHVSAIVSRGEEIAFHRVDRRIRP